MKYFVMNGDINDDLLTRFVDFFNQQNDSVSIILSSRGGFGEVADMIVDMIGKMPNVTLFINTVFSAAFEIAYKSKCKKVLCNEAKGMYHYGYRRIEINDTGGAHYEEDRFLLKQLPRQKIIAEKLASKFMNVKELKRFKSQEDVWIGFDRLVEIFPDAEVLP